MLKMYGLGPILDSMGLTAGDLLVESQRAKLRASALNELFERFWRVGDLFLRFGEQYRHDTQEAETLDRLETDLDLLRDDALGGSDDTVAPRAAGLDVISRP